MNWCDSSISLLQSATKLLVAPRLALLLGEYTLFFFPHLPLKHSMSIDQLTLALVTTVGVMIIHLPRRCLTSSQRR